MQGLVKWFDEAKGYGFIKNKDNEDVFVHYSEIIFDGFKTLYNGQKVNFTVVNTGKGLQAKNVLEVDI